MWRQIGSRSTNPTYAASFPEIPHNKTAHPTRYLGLVWLGVIYSFGSVVGVLSPAGGWPFAFDSYSMHKEMTDEFEFRAWTILSTIDFGG